MAYSLEHVLTSTSHLQPWIKLYVTFAIYHGSNLTLYVTLSTMDQT